MSTTKTRRTTETHKASALHIDPNVQRKVAPAHLRRIAENLDLDGIGVIVVNRRDDGTLSIMDGQHRVLALRENDMGEWPVKCDVYHGLTVPEENARFRVLNKTVKPGAWEDFRAGVHSGDMECLSVVAAAKRAGWTVADQNRDGHITAVAALMSLHDRGCLDDTLSVITAAWGHDRAAVNANVLKGIGAVVGSYNGELDRAALAQKLAKHQGGANGLLGAGRAWKNLHGGSVARSIALNVVELYNRGRRNGQLPPL